MAEKNTGLSRSKKLVGMFAVTMLVAGTAAGCSEETSSDCNDYDNDGYCDDDGGAYGYKKVKKVKKGVSTGKGGVGSSSKGSSS